MRKKKNLFLFLEHDIIQNSFGITDTIGTYNRSPIYIIHIQFSINWLNSSTFRKKEPPSSQPAARPDMPLESFFYARWVTSFGEDISSSY